MYQMCERDSAMTVLAFPAGRLAAITIVRNVDPEPYSLGCQPAGTGVPGNSVFGDQLAKCVSMLPFPL